MLFAEEMVKTNKCNSIRLDTNIDNPIMQKFVLKLGYVYVGSFAGTDPCYFISDRNEFYCYEKIIK